MAKIIVSQCLLGCDCRYNGDHCRNDRVMQLASCHVLIPICPEQMGGLPTPRDPSEIVGNRLLTIRGKDVTKEYDRGAEISLKIAKLNHADFAIMKTKSPSCGKGKIYDGTFTGKKIDGNGITVDLFLNHGIEVYSEEEMDEVEETLKNKHM